MKIALVITELHPGGAEKCFVNLACHLQSIGHQVGVWQLFPETPLEKRQLVELLEQHNIAICHGNVSRPWHFPSYVKRLRRELIRFAPDIVQSFLFHANLATSLACPQNTPLVGGARVSQPERWRGFLQNWSAKKMERLVCVSESVRANCEEKENIPAKKLLVIPNGIEPIETITQEQTRRLRESAGFSNQHKLILIAGRLSEQKGILPFLDQSESFLKANPNYRVVLLGDGKLRTPIETMIKSHSLEQQIRLLGWQPNALEWMQAADCLALPTLYEGMPNVVLEAMACGLPIVSFKVDGVEELLGEATDAQSAPPGDYDQFLARTKAILDDPELCGMLGERNQERAHEQFALQKQLLKYEELYRSLVRTSV